MSRKFGEDAIKSLKQAQHINRQVKMELLEIMDVIEGNTTNITKQEIKQKLFDLYKKIK